MSDKESKPQRNRKLVLRLCALGLGVGAGLICSYLPEQYRGLCQLSAKVLAFFIGG